MAKKTEARPLFDVKPDYDASLAKFIHEAGMLADAVRFRVLQGEPGPVTDTLRERLRAFDMARFGESDL